MIKQCVTTAVFFLMTQCFVYADDKIYHNRLNTCTPTKATIDNYEPKKFNTSNNLLHAPGTVEAFCGEEIILEGTLLDVNCVPVSDAKIYVWQAGCDGKYPYTPLRSKIDKSLINTNPVSSFQGSGIATTDNKGQFQFVTIYPSKLLNSPPHINIRVEHRHLGILQTQLFPHQPENGNEYKFNIVMDKANLYRRY